MCSVETFVPAGIDVFSFCLELTSWDCALVSSEKYVTYVLDEYGIMYSVFGYSHSLLALNFKFG
jgi:hypothetical protein